MNIRPIELAIGRRVAERFCNRKSDLRLRALMANRSFRGRRLQNIWGERALNQGQEFSIVERFDQKRERSRLHHGRLGGGIFVPGNKDYPGFRRFGTKVSQGFHPGHPFHPDVQHRNRNRVHR